MKCKWQHGQATGVVRDRFVLVDVTKTVPRHSPGSSSAAQAASTARAIALELRTFRSRKSTWLARFGPLLLPLVGRSKACCASTRVFFLCPGSVVSGASQERACPACLPQDLAKRLRRPPAQSTPWYETRMVLQDTSNSPAPVSTHLASRPRHVSARAGMEQSPLPRRTESRSHHSWARISICDVGSRCETASWLAIQGSTRKVHQAKHGNGNKARCRQGSIA